MLHAYVLQIGLSAVAQWFNAYVIIIGSRVRVLALLLVPGARNDAQNSSLPVPTATVTRLEPSTS